jgi:hypothetical protein
MAQGVLPIQYEEEKASSGVTALGGLLVYLDLIEVSGLCEAIKKYVAVCGKQGWLDLQMMLALIFLNLAGGDCVDDLERLEHDGGFAVILREIERFVLTRKERQAMKARWRRERTRTLPSPSSMSEWLECFHSAQEEEKRARHSSRRRRKSCARCGGSTAISWGSFSRIGARRQRRWTWMRRWSKATSGRPTTATRGSRPISR